MQANITFTPNTDTDIRIDGLTGSGYKSDIAIDDLSMRVQTLISESFENVTYNTSGDVLCVDSASFDVGYGGCRTYPRGLFNHNWCELDGADQTGACPIACGVCTPMYQGLAPDSSSAAWVRTGGMTPSGMLTNSTGPSAAHDGSQYLYTDATFAQAPAECKRSLNESPIQFGIPPSRGCLSESGLQ